MIVQASVTSVIDTIYSAYYALYYSIYCGSSVIFTTDTLARPLLYEACDCGRSNLLLFLFSNTVTHQKSINHRVSTFNIEHSPDKLRTIDPLSQAWYNTEAPRSDGPSPSGKAPGFGPGIRGFESLRPSHIAHASTHFFGGLFLYKRKPNKPETSLLYMLAAREKSAKPYCSNVISHSSRGGGSTTIIK